MLLHSNCSNIAKLLGVLFLLLLLLPSYFPSERRKSELKKKSILMRNATISWRSQIMVQTFTFTLSHTATNLKPSFWYKCRLVPLRLLNDTSRIRIFRPLSIFFGHIYIYTLVGSSFSKVIKLKCVNYSEL